LVLIVASLSFLSSYTSITNNNNNNNNNIKKIIFSNTTTANNNISSQHQQQSEPEPKLVDQSQLQLQLQLQLQSQLPEKNQHNTLLPPPLVPPALVIGAGAGSTGTHTMYCGTYLLGLPSVHWKLETDYCKSDITNNHNNITFFGGPYHYSGDTATTSTATTANMDKERIQQQQQQQQQQHQQWSRKQGNAHNQLVNKILRMKECLDKRNKKPESNKCPPETDNMIEWMEATKEMIDKVTSWHNNNNNKNNIGAIHGEF
jgi:hypothetical protein